MDKFALSKANASDNYVQAAATPILRSSALPSSTSFDGKNSSVLAQTNKIDATKRPSHPCDITSSPNSTSKELRNVNGTSNRCSNDPVTINAVKQGSLDWTSDDRCTYYPIRSDGCTEARSCRDCLNVDIGGEYSCMVNQSGSCVRKDEFTYLNKLDFEYQEPSNNGKASSDQDVQFPAYKVDYCRNDDTRCMSCRENAFKDVMEGRSNGSLTNFCYGEEGCVCIAVCEAPIWKKTIGQTVCNGTVVTMQHKKGYSSVIIGILGGLVAVVVLVATVVYVRHRRRESGGGATSDSANAESQDENAAAAGTDPTLPVASTLSLFGWQAMRSELIEREHLLLAGVEDFSNVRSGYLQLLDVDASAPPPEEDKSSAPVLLKLLAGASAPSFSPREVGALALAPSAPPASPSSTSVASPRLDEE